VAPKSAEFPFARARGAARLRQSLLPPFEALRMSDAFLTYDKE
jgi:hypothetical protein